jgi:hypothetical protein
MKGIAAGIGFTFAAAMRSFLRADRRPMDDVL